MDEGKKTRGSSSQSQNGDGSKRLVFRRTVALMLLCGVGLFIPILHQIWDISINHHDEYQARAAEQRLLSVKVSSARGDILDTNGNVLAVSATVYNLILAPADLVNSVDEKKFKVDGVVDQTTYQAAIELKRKTVLDGLMEILPELDEAKLAARLEKTNSKYEVIKTQIEEEEADKLQTFITENGTAYYLYLSPDTKRYYPYSALASQVLGFVNSKGGAYGVEAVNNSLLEGSPGWVLTEKTGKSVEMYSSYSDYIDSVSGYDLKLNIDSTIQSFAEKALEEGIEEFDVLNGAFCLVINPQTGAVLASASSPEFDPNNYSTVTDERLLAQMEASIPAIYDQLKNNNTEELTEEELQASARATAVANAQYSMWSNKGINEPYEPGSTFKALVLAAALEEGVIDENSTFYCPGYYTVNGAVIHCSDLKGHKDQTLAKAVQNSCNPAFMMIGQKLGAEKFYDYMETFGVMDKSGVDLPGEGTNLVWSREFFTSPEGYQSLATASFGQRLKLTPMQMITAFAATINGGYLLEPHVVQSVSDIDGTVIESTSRTVVRQVISQETSLRCRNILESVVSVGTGKNAYQAGYRIGGKTGTSETEIHGEVIVSFMAFAPADDPQVLVLLAYDRPNRAAPGSTNSTTGIYISGGNMPAKKVGPLIAEILDYMGIEKQYTKEESAAVDVTTPGVIGSSVKDAATALKDKNLKYRTVGEGDIITGQIPARGSTVPGGSNVILYLGGAKPEESATVPSVVGLSYEAAKKKLESAGFFMRAGGVSVFYGNASKAESQSVAEGETAAVGTVINVQFANMVEDGYVAVN